MGMVPDSAMHTNNPDTGGADLESGQSTVSSPTVTAQGTGTQVREPAQEFGFCFLSY